MSKFDAVVEAFGQLIADADGDAALELYNTMQKWQTENPRTHRQLRSVPAFRKLWDVMDEATDAAMLEAGNHPRMREVFAEEDEEDSRNEA